MLRAMTPAKEDATMRFHLIGIFQDSKLKLLLINEVDFQPKVNVNSCLFIWLNKSDLNIF